MDDFDEKGADCLEFEKSSEWISIVKQFSPFTFSFAGTNLTFQFSGRGVEVIDRTRSVPLFHSVSFGLTKNKAMSGVKKAVWD